MKDPWEKAYVYGRAQTSHKAVHILDSQWHQWTRRYALCGAGIDDVSQTSKPYPVCKNCLKTKRAKELGL